MADQTNEPKTPTVAPAPRTQTGVSAKTQQKSSNPRVQLKRGLQLMSFDEQASLLALDPVQRDGGGAGTDQVHTAAAHGIAGGGGAMPHADKIQAAFGGHDISGIQAHTGSAATQANQAMGAEAYATGNHVAFSGAPDLHTAAHESAHVIQQAHGVSLSGGVGQVGDSYEQHADQVADAVVKGESAEPILNQMTGGAPGGGTQMKATQRAAVQLSPRSGTVVQFTGVRPLTPISGTDSLPSTTGSTDGAASVGQVSAPPRDIAAAEAGITDITPTMSAPAPVSTEPAPPIPAVTPPAPGDPPRAVTDPPATDASTVLQDLETTVASAPVGPQPVPTPETVLPPELVAETLVAAPAQVGGPVAQVTGATVTPAPVPAPVAPTPINPDGLAASVVRGAFVTAAHTVQTQWATLATPEARANLLGAAVNTSLAAAGVPATTISVSNLGAGRNGELDFRSWSLSLNRALFTAATPDTAALAAAADTVYHEARHAEQWHKMARLLAGREGKSAVEIQARLGIPLNIATHAHARPEGRDPTTTNPLFVAWFESVYGNRAAHRNTTLNNLGPHSTALTAAATAEQAALTANQAAAEQVRLKGVEVTTKATDVQTKTAAVTAIYNEWNTKNTQLTQLEPTYQAKRQACTDALARRDAATTDWRTKRDTRELRAQAWHTAKATMTGCSDRWRTRSADREAKAATWHSTNNARTQREAAFAAAKQRFEAGTGDTTALRQAAVDAYNAWVQAHNSWATADAEWQASDAAFRQVDAEWTVALTAFTTANDAWRTADEEYNTSTTAWRTIDAAFTTARDEFNQIHAQKTALEAEVSGLVARWRTAEGERLAAQTAWNTANTELTALNTAWRTRWAEYQTAQTNRATARATFDATYAAYRALPEEVDAWREGDAVRQEYMRRFGPGGTG